MTEIPSNAATGSDGFPAVLLKRCCAAHAPPPANIWRQSLFEGTFPSNCNLPHIIPVHRHESCSLPKNYRSTPFTSLVMVFEKVTSLHLVKFMEQHEQFNHSQYIMAFLL